MSIQEIILKIKGLVGEPSIQALLLKIVLGLAFLGGVLAAYYGGRLSILKNQVPPGPQMVYPPLVEAGISCYNNEINSPSRSHVSSSSVKRASQKESSSPTSQKSYIGSKSGKVYYPASCKSVNRIKPENRVYFESEQAASSAGRTRAKACGG